MKNYYLLLSNNGKLPIKKIKVEYKKIEYKLNKSNFDGYAIKDIAPQGENPWRLPS